MTDQDASTKQNFMTYIKFWCQEVWGIFLLLLNLSETGESAIPFNCLLDVHESILSIYHLYAVMHEDIILNRSKNNNRASASRWFYYKTLFWNFKYCHMQIEKVSYWFSSKQSMSNYVSLWQDMHFLLAFP